MRLTISPAAWLGMAAVVFLRGVNVGGHRAFRPAAFARALPGLDVANVGAAGTFVVSDTVSRASLRAAFLRRLPFETEIMICGARDLSDLVAADPFPRGSDARGARRFVSVLGKSPRTMPRLPLSHPAGGAWQVKVVGLRGRFALSVWRRTGKAMVYPNEVVERALGVPATTRTWDTILKVHDLLRGA